MLKPYKIILIFGIIEILIGSITIFSNISTLILSLNTKTPNVLLFVIATGIASTLIGIGLLKFNKPAYRLLIYFSSMIILSKILIFMNVIQLNGALETAIPAFFKRIISVAYHGFVIYYLTRHDVKEVFEG